MARGWESKSVEAQQEEAGRPAAGGSRAALSADERGRLARRQVLMLARARVHGDLERAAAPAQRAMLERALADLDRTIADLA